MSDSYFEYYFPTIVGFIVGYSILLSGGTIIEAILVSIFIAIVGGLAELIIYKLYLESILDNMRETRKKHKDEIVNRILSKKGFTFGKRY